MLSLVHDHIKVVQVLFFNLIRRRRQQLVNRFSEELLVPKSVLFDSLNKTVVMQTP